MKIITKARHFQTIDSILPDGIPQSSTVALVGSPGAGKTIFAAQTMFGLDPSVTAIWFSTFSEPQNLLLSHLANFDFYDKTRIGSSIQFIDLATVFGQGKNLESVLELIESEAQKYEADVIFIDSFRQILQWANVSKSGFHLIQNMPLYFSMRGITTFLIGEYNEEDIANLDFFGMVDGVISLNFEKEGFKRNRYIEILKMRGANFDSGMHPVRITNEGYHIFSQQKRRTITEATTEKIGTGVKGANEMLMGGLLKNSFTLIAGASGAGKSIFGMHFLTDGISNGENVLLYSMEEERPQILRNAASIGLDYVQSEKSGLLTVLNPRYPEMSLEETLSEIQKVILEKKVTRCFLDSLSSLSHGRSELRFDQFTQSLRSFAKEHGVTLITATETTDVVSSGNEDDVHISSLTDTIISLRYVEVEGSMKRALMIVKARGSDHDKSLREYRIDDKGFHVGHALEGVEGILSGSGHRIGASTGEKIHEELLDTFGPLADAIFREIRRENFNLDFITSYLAEKAQKGIIPEEDANKLLKQITNILKN